MDYNQDDIVKNMSQSEKQKELLKMGYIYYIQAGISLLFFIICYALKKKFRSCIFLVFAIVFVIFGLEYLFSSDEKKEEFLISKLVNDKISAYKKTGKVLSQDDIASIRFSYDPIYKKKVIEEIHREVDEEHDLKVQNAEKEVSDLIERRKETLAFIKDQRWEVYDNNLSYNYEEGKVLLFGQIMFFSDITGAELKEDLEKRLFTTVCKHLGVVVDLNGFKREIIYLNEETDKSNKEYINAYRKANDMLNMLTLLARTPVPDEYLPPEEDQRIKELDEQINQARVNLDVIKSTVPVYEIPQKYLKEI